MKLLASIALGIFMSVTTIATCFGGAVTLPWSSSLNCSSWTYDGSYNVTPPSGCSEFVLESSGSACGTYSAIVPAANRSGSAGNGIRQLVGAGVNVQTTGFDINFGAQSSVWIRWYQRYQSGFGFSTLNYHKDVYVVDYVSSGTHQYAIAEPYGSTYRVAWWNGTTSDAVYGNGSVGWSQLGDGNWHLYELHLTQSGTIQMWIDQTQIINGTTSASFPYTWGLVLFGSNASDVSSNCAAIDYDDLAISNTGYIGPVGGSTPAPTPTPTTYTITASAGTGGSISPTGTRTVSSGASQAFTITPNSGYKVSSVVVDGASVGAVSTYTFSNVTSTHTIAATFASTASATYTITASAGTGGSISPTGAVSVSTGTSRSFTITPDAGDKIGDVVVDGASVGAVSTYTFSNVTTNHTIAASFSTSVPPSDQLLLYEGFEDLNWASRSWYDNTAHGVLAASGCYSGKCLQWSWAQGATMPTNGTGVRKLFTATDEVFLRYYMMIDPNWQGSGLSYQPHMIQFLSDKDDAYQGPAYSNLDTYFEINGSTPKAVFVIQDSALINTTQGTPPVNLAGITENRSVAGCNGYLGDPGTSESCYQSGSWFNGRTWKDTTTLTKGAWHKMEYYLKMNTISNGIANADGILELWIDGTQTLSKTNIVYRTNQQATKKWNQMFFGPYMGSGSPIAQSIWIDELSIYNANQLAPVSTPPTIPTGLTIGP